MTEKLDIVRLAGKSVDLCLIRDDEEALRKYATWVNDASINQWVGHQDKVIQMGQEASYIHNIVNGENDPKTFTFGIVVKNTRELIGTCSLSIYSVSGDIGILIGEPGGQEKGYGTETIKMLVDYAFKNFLIHRLELNVVGDNFRAQRCYEKAGFTKCGTKHEACYFNGKFVDLIQMEILRQTWEERKEE